MIWMNLEIYNKRKKQKKILFGRKRVCYFQKMYLVSVDG